MARLEVDIDANIQGLQSSVDAAIKTATKLGNPFEKTTGIINTLNQRASILRKNLESATDIKSIAQYNRRLQETQNELQRVKGLGTQSLSNFGNSAQKTSNQIGGLSRATSTYNGIGIEFSRIIQDAPFGIIGIGNNIQQLAGSFQQLRAQSSSTGAALKTALSSIISPANLLVLGISALTSALTYLSMNGFFKSKESAEDAREALDKYKESLDAVSRSVIQGNIDAQNEVQNFKLLKAQIDSETTSRAKKLEAVEALKKQYPDFLGNISNEKILVGDVGDAYQRLTTSLLETAKARAASNIIIENTEQVLILQRQQIDNEQAIIDARDKVARLESSAQNSAVNALRINGQITAENTDLIRAKEELNKLLEPQIERGNQINKLTTDNLNLNNEINDTIKNGATFTEGTIEKVKELAEETGKLSNITFLLDKINLEQSENFKKNLEKNVKSFFDENSGSQAIDIPLDINFIPTELNQELGIIETLKAQISSITALRDVATDPARIFAYNEQLKVLQGQIGAFTSINDSVKSSVQDLSNAFTGLGSVIGKAFNNPQLGTFLGQFTQFVVKVVAGAFAVSKANAIAGATQSSLFTGPAAAFTLPAFIAGAVGLVASAFSGIKGGGGGSKSSSGGGSAVSGVNSMTYSGSGLGSQGYNNNVTFTIEGTTLKGVLERTTDRFAKG